MVRRGITWLLILALACQLGMSRREHRCRMGDVLRATCCCDASRTAHPAKPRRCCEISTVTVDQAAGDAALTMGTASVIAAFVPAPVPTVAGLRLTRAIDCERATASRAPPRRRPFERIHAYLI